MSKVITGDKSYIHIYMSETKERSKEWLDKDDPHPQKAVRGWGTKYSKCMLVLFLTAKALCTGSMLEGKPSLGKCTSGSWTGC